MGGILLDRQFDTEPVLTLIGVAMGLIAAGYTLYEMVVLSDSKRGVIRLSKSESRDGSNQG